MQKKKGIKLQILNCVKISLQSLNPTLTEILKKRYKIRSFLVQKNQVNVLVKSSIFRIENIVKVTS